MGSRASLDVVVKKQIVNPTGSRRPVVHILPVTILTEPLA